MLFLYAVYQERNIDVQVWGYKIHLIHAPSLCCISLREKHNLVLAERGEVKIVFSIIHSNKY